MEGLTEQISSKRLKKAWKAAVESGGFSGSYRDWLRQQAKRADEIERFRQQGSTDADAASLLLERK